MRSQAVRAIYKDGRLIFADPTLAPKGVTEVLVTYLEEFHPGMVRREDLIHALRGRGKGERLVERLRQARQEDRERDERSGKHLRA